jgi:hypothetical protein
MKQPSKEADRGRLAGKEGQSHAGDAGRFREAGRFIQVCRQAGNREVGQRREIGIGQRRKEGKEHQAGRCLGGSMQYYLNSG